MIYVILIVLAILIYFIIRKFIKPYKLDFDTICCFTGGAGSGKTFNSVSYALKLLKQVRRSVKSQNRKINLYNKTISRWFNREPLTLIPVPLLYSNIPVRINKKEMCAKLKVSHLTLNEKIVQNSIVLIDEIGQFAGSWDYKNPNLQSHGCIEEYFRLFRHYVDGKIIINDQTIDSIAKCIRSRVCKHYELFGFKNVLNIFGYTNIRHQDIAIDNNGVVNVTSGHSEAISSKLYFWLLGQYHYDSRCHSNRYVTVGQCKVELYNKDLKSNYVLDLPEVKVESATDKFDSL